MTTMGGKHKSVFCRKIGNLTISIIYVINHGHIHLSKNVGFRRDIFFESEIRFRHGVHIYSHITYTPWLKPISDSKNISQAKPSFS